MKYQVVLEIACDVEASSKDEAIDTAWNELEQRMEQLPGWYMTSGVYAEDIEEDMPVFFSLYKVAKMLVPLAAYQAETGEYGANVENPFYSVQVPKNKED